MARDNSTVVEHSNHNPNIECSNPHHKPLEREIYKKMSLQFMARGNSTGVKHLNHNPKIECSNPTTSLWREKLLKHCDSRLEVIAQWLNSLIIILIFRVQTSPLVRGERNCQKSFVIHR
jgi:hypothetical protein